MNVAIISAISTIVGAVIAGIVAVLVADKQYQATIAEVNAKHNESITLIEYRLKQLEDKVDKHNNLVERMYAVETRLRMMTRSE